MDRRQTGGTVQFRLNNRNMALIGGGATVLLVVVFAIGVVVGKGLSKIQQTAPVADYEVAPVEALVVDKSAVESPESDLFGEALQEEALREEKPAAVERDGVTYGFYDADEGAPAKLPDAASPPASERPLPPPPVAAPAPEPEPEALERETAPPPSAVKPIEKPATPPPPAPKPKVDGGSKKVYYTVQVASFPTEPEATRLIAKLKGKGLGAYMQQAHVRGSLWYRVRVGKFAEKAGAESMAAVIAEKEGVKPFIDIVTE